MGFRTASPFSGPNTWYASSACNLRAVEKARRPAAPRLTARNENIVESKLTKGKAGLARCQAPSSG